MTMNKLQPSTRETPREPSDRMFTAEELARLEALILEIRTAVVAGRR